jgi:hypothetical protein
VALDFAAQQNDQESNHRDTKRQIRKLLGREGGAEAECDA